MGDRASGLALRAADVSAAMGPAPDLPAALDAASTLLELPEVPIRREGSQPGQTGEDGCEA